MEIIHMSKNRRQHKILRAVNATESDQEVTAIKKCLFGVPDFEDIENMLEEQQVQDWQRIKDRFGLDLDDLENLENIQHSITPSSKTKKKKTTCTKLQEKRLSGGVRRRRLFNPYDRKITDFYQERKNNTTEKKDA